MRRHRLWTGLAIAGYLTLVVVSLVPREFRPRTGESHYLEHFFAYMLVSICFALAIRSTKGTVAAIAALGATAGTLELLQNLSPGRSPEFAGFVAGAFGALAGAVVVVGVLAITKRSQRDRL